ncbi:hypothetical protein CEXT_704061 [Caerostris extrusa]|uniref:Uncharacterized protein n=1 Tax=Caerostris extrusa TaxID=172846 RepID=A0AAV4TLM8_CAEEX|nr:hypothetical protein CEXT_704061 [Caerostris extrusa]
MAVPRGTVLATSSQKVPPASFYAHIVWGVGHGVRRGLVRRAAIVRSHKVFCCARQAFARVFGQSGGRPLENVAGRRVGMYHTYKTIMDVPYPPEVCLRE